MPVSDQGFNSERYQVIPRSLIFIFDEDRVLLLQGDEDKKIWAGKYNGIGGHIEAGEDILESASRELAEETGLSGLPLRLCGQVMITLNENQGIALFIFTGIYSGQSIKESEEGALEWVAMEDLQNLPIVEDLPKLLYRVVEHQPGDPLIVGKYYYDVDRLVMLFH
jgi:8-oxo-dGTP diphosphatase